MPYCNDWGFFDAADVYLAPSQTMYWDLMPVIYTPPAVRSVFIRGMVVEKRPNDVFRLNYELAFLSNPSDADPILVYPAFVGNSSAVQRVKPGYVRIRIHRRIGILYGQHIKIAAGGSAHQRIDVHGLDICLNAHRCPLGCYNRSSVHKGAVA